MRIEDNIVYGIKYAKHLAQCLAHQGLLLVILVVIISCFIQTQALQIIFAKHLWGLAPCIPMNSVSKCMGR